jgi:hypothetical protein
MHTLAHSYVEVRLMAKYIYSTCANNDIMNIDEVMCFVMDRHRIQFKFDANLMPSALSLSSTRRSLMAVAFWSTTPGYSHYPNIAMDFAHSLMQRAVILSYEAYMAVMNRVPLLQAGAGIPARFYCNLLY